MHGCGLLLQMSHVAWSVCVCVLGTWLNCAKRLNRSRCRLGVDSCWSKKPYFRCGSRSPTGRGTFEVDNHMRRLIVSALRPPRANVPVQHPQRSNAFIAARDDNTAMQTLAELLWTLVIIIKHFRARWQTSNEHVTVWNDHAKITGR